MTQTVALQYVILKFGNFKELWSWLISEWLGEKKVI